MLSLLSFDNKISKILKNYKVNYDNFRSEVVNVIVNAEVSYDLVSRRQNLNPEAEVVRVMVIVEMARTVIVHEITVTRRDSVDIMVFNPEIHGVVHPGTTPVVVRLAHVSGNGAESGPGHVRISPYHAAAL